MNMGSNKFTPKVKKPGSHKFPQAGPHNPNVGMSGSGMAPKPKSTAPGAAAITRQAMPMHNLARVKNTGTGPQLGVTTAPTGPQPGGMGGMAMPMTPETGPVATRKPKKSNHPFFGSNEYGY